MPTPQEQPTQTLDQTHTTQVAQGTAANQDTQASTQGTEFNRTTTTTIIAPSGADTIQTSTAQTPADAQEPTDTDQAQAQEIQPPPRPHRSANYPKP